MESNNQPTRTTGHRRRRLEIWDHFEKKAECKYCNALLCADSVKDGTSRLRRHYEETCPVRHPRPMPASNQGSQSSHSASVLEANRNLKNAPGISNFVPDNSSQQMVAAAKDQLLKMIALHGFPSLLVEDIEFSRFVRMLCSDFQMPSREDVEERCDALFDQEMSSLKDALGRTSGLVSLSVGRAQTAMVEVVFLAAHFIDDEWNLCRRVLRVFKVTHESDEPTYDNILNVKDHCVSWGHYNEVVGTTASWGLLPKLTGAILDAIFSSKFRNILCQNNHLEHLSETQYKVFRAIDIHWQLDLVARILTAHSADPCMPYGEHCLHAFVKLCLTKKELRDTTSCLRLNHPWTYNRWWYALYYALQILHTKCSSGAEEIAGLVGNATFQETDTTELFRTTLDAVYKAIETVAASNSPTSNLSLIELVKLKRKLDSGRSIAPRRNCEDNNEEQTDDEETSEEQTDYEDDYDARPAFEETKRYLHEFIEKSYLSQSIPLILDPRFKLIHVKRLLKKASLSSTHISEVQAVVRRLFQDYSNQGNARGNTNRRNENEMDINIFHKMYEMSSSTWQNFDQSRMELDHRSSMESGTELDNYLQEKTVSIKEENFDILTWWKENCRRYPTVARMARDFLAIPTSTRPTPQLMTEITNHLRRYA